MCLYSKKIINPKLTKAAALGLSKFLSPDVPTMLTVGCGRCIECVQQSSREWSFRIMDEIKLHPENCFITLTYDNDHVPQNGVQRRDVQLFMKRLRKAISPQRVRFFACGEYGKKHRRPHYHIILFGWSPKDLWFWCKDHKGTKLYRSPSLEKLWTFGFSSVGVVTLDTAKYCAKYMQKFEKLPKGLNRPFLQMSTKPGIGAAAAYSADMLQDKMWFNGEYCRVPRYYLKLLERQGADLNELKRRRLDKIQYMPTDEERRKKYDKFLRISIDI